jgi:hypothetical protein
VRMSGELRPTRQQIVLAAATIASYAIGYPVAIVANAWFGWVLVTLGGLFLFALVVVTIQRMNRRS